MNGTADDLLTTEACLTEAIYPLRLIAFLLTAAASVLLSITVASASCFYVGPDGSDAYSVAQAQSANTPWATVAPVCAVLQPGDTVEFLPGRYAANSWKISANGAPGKPITFIGGNGKSPAPVLTFSEWSALDIVGSSYLVFRNFEVTSTDTDPATCSYGISISGRSHHITIENCRIHDCGGGGIGTTNQDGGGCDYIQIRDNTIYNNAEYSKYEESGISLWEQSNLNPSDTGVHNVIEGNVCYGNSNKYVPGAKHTDGEGIIIDCGYEHSSAQGGKDTPDAVTLVSRNTCYDNGGSGVESYLDDEVVFDRNTCYENAQDPLYGGGGEILVNASAGCQVKNNVCYSTGSVGDDCLKVYADGGSTSIVDNVFWGVASKPASGAGYVFADPEFKNPTMPNPDFRVQFGGPADTTTGICGAWGTY